MFSRQWGKCFLTLPGQTHPRRLVQGQNPSERQSQAQTVAARAPRTLGGSRPISAAAGKSPKGPEEDERGLNLGSGLVCWKAQLALRTASPAVWWQPCKWQQQHREAEGTVPCGTERSQGTSVHAQHAP